MMMRRSLLRLLGVGPLAVWPGKGGTPDPPAGYTPPDQPGVAAGSSNIVRARLVIISGAGGGMFIYSGTPGPGNPPILSFSDASTDPYGNAIQLGSVSYGAAGAFAQLFSSSLALSFGSGTPGNIFAAGAGNLAINSGSVSGDVSAQIQLESATASGVPNGEAFIIAGTLIINAANVKLASGASQQIPATRPSITALGSTWNATTASQANTNFNNILNFLTAIGVST